MQRLPRLILRLRCVTSSTWNLPTSTCHVVITGASKQCSRNEIPTFVAKHSYRLLHTSFLTQGDSEGENQRVAKDQSRSGQLRRVLREYGTVAVVFHTCISLASLGTCYMVVSMGLDVEKFLKFLHVNVDMSSYKTASTLAVAYILHKVFLPVRAFITISSVPFIVRFLRARGIMKPVAKQPSVGGS